MNNKITVITVVMAVLVSGAVAVAAVPSSTAANAEDSHEISECTTIDEPGTYRLTNDIAADGDGDECLSVEAHGVTIDGNGHSITNASGPQWAIYSWTDDLVVKNLTVSGFSTAISLEMGADVTVDGVTLRDNGLGIEGTQVSPNVNNSVFEGNDVAISASESRVDSANTVYRNNGEGITAGYVVSVNDTYVGNGDFAIEAPAGSVSSATIENNGGNGIVFVENYVSPNDENEFTVVDSVIRENEGHGIYVPEDANPGGQNLTVENSVIADNSGLGIKVGAGNPTADATDNYWGESDGPSSATDEHAPFEDPVTGKLAFGIGDEVSENPDQQGISNVHFDPFLTENPNADGSDDEQDDESDDENDEKDDQKDDQSDDGEQDDDQSDSDDKQNSEDDSERSSDGTAYQFDVAVGEVIGDLGEDEDDFYGTQGRLVRAQTVAGNGTVTGHFMEFPEDYAGATSGCEVYGSTVDYDSENGTVTATLSHTGDADCGNVTMTFAAYELPGDDVTFVREHADDQELVAYRTVTLEPGEEVEITLDLNE